MTLSFHESTVSAARLVAVKEIFDEPGIGDGDLTARLCNMTPLATPTIRELLLDLEREKHVRVVVEAQGKAYLPSGQG